MESKIKSTDGGTIARTVILIFALINQLFAAAGIEAIGIQEDTIYQLCSAAATVAAALVSWWKNNNFTQEAKLAQRIKEDMMIDGIE